MPKMYQYTLLKQDGTIDDLGQSPEKSLEELYEILECDLVEIIPSPYYAGKGHGKCIMWGDEEGRFNSNNVRNPHFNVLAGGYDVVGNIVKQQSVKKEKNA